ncbi:MAG: transglycosylase domain-containing protein, partial [Anaerolineales bacterium]|nr:transglycosylase domain-containing protein [Anaerolineales bacterium]
MPKPARIIKWRIRRQQRRQRSGVNVFRWLSVIVLGLATAVFTFIILGAVGVTAVFASFTRDLPDFTELERLGQDSSATFETTKIYAWGQPAANGQRDLTLIYEVIDPLGGDRQWLPLDQIPQQLIDATIAIEDRTFYTNQGFDMIGIGRAFNEY